MAIYGHKTKMSIKKTQMKYFLSASLGSVFLLSGLFFSANSAQAEAMCQRTINTQACCDFTYLQKDCAEVGTWKDSCVAPACAAIKLNSASSATPVSGNQNSAPSATPVSGNQNSAPSATPVSGKQNASAGGVVMPTSTGLADRSIKDILTNLLNWLLMIVGILALIGFIISGIQYILAAGDEKLMETGKKNMLYSIMGIVVVLASFVIIQAIDRALWAQSLF